MVKSGIVRFQGLARHGGNEMQPFQKDGTTFLVPGISDSVEDAMRMGMGVAGGGTSTVAATPQKCVHCGKETHKRLRAYHGSIHVYSDGDGDILEEKDPDSGPYQVAEVCPDCCKSADSMEGHWLKGKLGTF